MDVQRLLLNLCCIFLAFGGMSGISTLAALNYVFYPLIIVEVLLGFIALVSAFWLYNSRIRGFYLASLFLVISIIITIFNASGITNIEIISIFLRLAVLVFISHLYRKGFFN